MPWAEVIPVIDHAMRAACLHPYPGHPQGCPNFTKQERCPPQAPLFERFKFVRVFAVWNRFEFGPHIAKLRVAHPDWSEKQLYCSRYWQGTARKQLRLELSRFQYVTGTTLGWTVLTTPEACGVNIFATMGSIGIKLEHTPRVAAYQVALAGWNQSS
jgi:hypothetical protein